MNVPVETDSATKVRRVPSWMLEGDANLTLHSSLLHTSSSALKEMELMPSPSRGEYGKV